MTQCSASIASNELHSRLGGSVKAPGAGRRNRWLRVVAVLCAVLFSLATLFACFHSTCVEPRCLHTLFVSVRGLTAAPKAPRDAQQVGVALSSWQDDNGTLHGTRYTRPDYALSSVSGAIGRNLQALRGRRGSSSVLSRIYRFDAGSVGELPPPVEVPRVACKVASDCPGALHTCLNSTCTCPPILRGNANCTAQTPVAPKRAYCFSSVMDHKKKLIPESAINSTLAFLLPDMAGPDGMQDLQRRAEWSRCAVVGSSGVLSKSKLGEEIDNHTAVIRFNNAPTKKFSADVGAKTTLRVQNADYCSHAESKNEMCINYTLRRQCTPTSKHPIRCEGDKLVTASRAFVNLVHEYWTLNRPRNGKSVMTDVSCRWVCPGNPPMMRASGTKMSINKFKPNPVDIPEAIRRCSRRCDKKTSAGFFGILFAAHICGEVEVYGFPRAAANLRYYFPKQRSVAMVTTNPPEARHHWHFEKLCLNYLRVSGIPGLKIYG
eukprot:CAMPEP_0177787782 /NCGR_PEP_ID=MMETSP0491_2-20121128/21711_1 /TAXON_ID=63592 /ORGANISM="Tetraselmis chuii, Strain PLY429" /LENGTH=489 /DNA_ID=CAMNT_0019309225 /DNA_START=247 /DNA_END=1716 /DNA_ORIENTATION=-